VQKELCEYMHQNDIAVVAYSPLGRIGKVEDEETPSKGKERINYNLIFNFLKKFEFEINC